MPLKVRFRHGTAERLVDLPDRNQAKPLIIGRGNDVDLRLPFDGVAPQHAALFFKDDGWVIQGMSGVVTVGGKALAGPAKLQVGDVIALGTNSQAPTLQIEPKAAGVSAPSPATAPEAVVVRPQRTPAPAPSRVRPASPQPEAGPQDLSTLPDPSTLPQIPLDDRGPEEDDAIEWDPQTPVPEAIAFYVPRRRGTPVVVIILTAILGGGLLVGAGMYVYSKTRQPAVIIVRQVVPPPPVPAPANTHKPLFDLNMDQQPPAPEDASKSANPSAAPKISHAAPVVADADRSSSPIAHSAGNSKTTASRTKMEEAPPDPNDAEWNDIRSAYFNIRHQGVAILKYDEYRQDHPGKFTALLDQYTDEAVNWLYWQRVAQLWARQDDLTADLRQKTRDIQNQPAGAFHEQLVKEKADVQAKADETKRLLTEEMGYHGDIPPDLENTRQLKTLADSRDPAKFADFRKRVLRYVRFNHGSVWWDGE